MANEKYMSLKELTAEAEKFAQAHNSNLDALPEVLQRLEGPDHGMFAAITGFNEQSYRKEKK